MENISAPRYLASLPLRLQNNLIALFPRKYFGFLRHAVEDKYFSHPLLLNKPLQATTPPPLPDGYRFGLIDTAGLKQIMAHREALPASVYHNRFAKGDVCYALSVNDEIVTLQWISTSQCGIFRGFDKGVDFYPLAPHQAYTYDFYTYRNKRKFGYGTVLKQQLLAALAARGCSELLTCVMYDNLESLKIHLKLNYTLKGLPCNFRLMDWQWTTWGSDKQVDETRQWLDRFTRDLSNRNQQA
ncbi:MAG: GNAT family N-acetyltransferase [Pseudomonadota bacterium]